MFRIRQSSREDVEQILAVAEHLDTVNLPADRARIEHILALSEESFAATVPVADREYLFVLEDLAKQRVIGTSMIHAQHGTKRAPHVFFRVENDERYSYTLDRYFVHRTLRIGYNYTGPTEIGGLILLPEYRGNPASLGKLLSYTRFVFIRMHRPLFRDHVLSELLPPLEPDGTSKLWEHLGRHFTGLSYQEADLLSKDNKEFIHALFPDDPIHCELLPPDVQDVIGQVGPETRGVEKMLRRIGFEYAEQIDPFDGGPHFSARTDDITLVRDARQVTLEPADDVPADGPWAIVATGEPAGFRAIGARVAPAGEDRYRIAREAADRLGHGGAPVWLIVCLALAGLVGCADARAQDRGAGARLAGVVQVPAAWEPQEAIAEAARADGVDAAAWGDPGLGCFAVVVAAEDERQHPEDALEELRAAMAEQLGLTGWAVAVPTDARGKLSRGTLTGEVRGGAAVAAARGVAVTLAACFYNQRAPAACAAQCQGVLASLDAAKVKP